MQPRSPVLSCVALSMIVSCAGAAGSDTIGFQKYQWGDSERDVQRSQPKPLHAGPGGIVYRDKLGDVAGQVTFRFGAGKLNEVRYRFVAEHEHPDGFVADFGKVEQLLIAQHGAPQTRQSEWLDPKGQTDQLGTAIAAGELTQLTQWRTPTSTIIHSLYGDEGKISHSLVYQPLGPPASPELLISEPVTAPTEPASAPAAEPAHPQPPPTEASSAQ